MSAIVVAFALVSLGLHGFVLLASACVHLRDGKKFIAAIQFADAAVILTVFRLVWIARDFLTVTL